MLKETGNKATKGDQRRPKGDQGRPKGHWRDRAIRVFRTIVFNNENEYDRASRLDETHGPMQMCCK